LIVATALTGCGRAGLRNDSSTDPGAETPTQTEAAQESPANDLDAIEEDLAAVDGALEQSAGDAAAADDASATNDEP
jgi:hypothetical protein